MGKKKKKKTSKKRTMRLVCLDCSKVFRVCDCKKPDKAAFMLVNNEEMEYFFETGLVPDYDAELMYAEGEPRPKPVPFVWPPKYSFKVD